MIANHEPSFAPKLSGRLRGVVRRRPGVRRSAAGASSGEVDCVIVGAGAAGIAAARRLARGRAQLHPDRGVGPDRRPLRRRDEKLRRAVRSRRASDPQSGHQSADASSRAHRSRDLSGAVRRSASASAGATRARASSRIISRHRCAPTARCGRGARQGRHRCAQRACRRISASGSPPSSSRSGPIAAARTSMRFRRSISAARRTATSLRSAARATARCWPSSPRAFRCSSTRGRSSSSHRRGSKVERRHDKGAIIGRFCIITASTNAVLDRHQVRRRPAEAPSGGAREAEARQLRSHRAGANRQSARAAARRSGVREIVGPAHRGAARQCRRHAAVGG